MKYKIFLTVLCFLSLQANSQSSYLSIRNNLFTASKSTEFVDIDTLLRKPKVESTAKIYDFDIAYKKLNENGNGVFARIGYSAYSQETEQVELVGNGNNGFNKTNVEQFNQTFSIGFGAFHQFLKTKKVFSNVETSMLLQFQPEWKIKLKRDYFDENTVFIGTHELRRSVARTVGIGVNINNNLYYKITNRISVGMEVNLNILFENQKGTEFENPKWIDVNGQTISEINVPHVRKDNSIQRQFFVSLGLMYSM